MGTDCPLIRWMVGQRGEARLRDCTFEYCAASVHLSSLNLQGSDRAELRQIFREMENLIFRWFIRNFWRYFLGAYFKFTAQTMCGTMFVWILLAFCLNFQRLTNPVLGIADLWDIFPDVRKIELWLKLTWRSWCAGRVQIADLPLQSSRAKRPFCSCLFVCSFDVSWRPNAQLSPPWHWEKHHCANADELHHTFQWAFIELWLKPTWSWIAVCHVWIVNLPSSTGNAEKHFCLALFVCSFDVSRRPNAPPSLPWHWEKQQSQSRRSAPSCSICFYWVVAETVEIVCES